MKTLMEDIYRLKVQKEIAWFISIIFIMVGLPILKNALVSILIKLYEIFIQKGH